MTKEQAANWHVNRYPDYKGIEFEQDRKEIRDSFIAGWEAKEATLDEIKARESKGWFSNDRLIDFVNWYLKVKGIPGNMELENQYIIDSFLKGDSPRLWNKELKQKVFYDDSRKYYVNQEEQLAACQEDNKNLIEALKFMFDLSDTWGREWFKPAIWGKIDVYKKLCNP